MHRLKSLVLDSVSCPIVRRVCNLGLDEFIVWFAEAPRRVRAFGVGARVVVEWLFRLG